MLRKFCLHFVLMPKQVASAEDEGHFTLRGVLGCLSDSAGPLESPCICFTGVLSSVLKSGYITGN
jgi:hypothetical protein